MKPRKWLDNNHPQNQTADPVHPRKTAFFGYQKLPEDKKAQRVLQHFNTVAQKYDLMNTLLSFGIHHLWKRTAVKTMTL
ncbi:MAG: class I SAM-dependent methyltransferase, partial [Deltaproteobacteria bacterium]|nr:class I SAM-dependent methyltransferase [Deltaproteobacteria bacterium]MBW2325820.1 class I SAM-dependent methyltransferase [Deltaproteobacteria bacterium]